MKKRIYVDMDGVMCDFYGAARKALVENPLQPFPQSQWGFFLKLEPISDSLFAIRQLDEHYDVWILTKPSTKNVNCYTEKAQWILDHLGYSFLERLIISPDKFLLKGDYLIDDNHWNFDGEHLHFGTDKYPDWNSILEYLMPK